MDEVLDGARLLDAPVAVALHRLVEGIVCVLRRYPGGVEQMRCVPEAYNRVMAQRERVETFLQRAADEGVVRSDLPPGLANAAFFGLVDLVSGGDFAELEPGYAADLAVDTLLNGVGTH